MKDGSVKLLAPLAFIIVLWGFWLVNEDDVSDGFYLGALLIVIVYPLLSSDNFSKGDIFSPLVLFGSVYFVAYWVGSLKFIIIDNEDVSIYLFYSALGYAFFYLGYLVSKPRRGIVKDIVIGKRHAQIVVITLMVVSILAAVVMVSQVGVPALYDDKFHAKLEARELVSSYVIYLIRVCQFAAYVSVVYALTKLRSKGRGFFGSKSFYLSASVLVVALILNFLPGWRGPVFIIAFNCLLIYHYFYRKMNFSRFALSLITGFLLIFGWGFWRILSSPEGVDSLSYLNLDAGTSTLFWGWVSYQFSAYFLGFKVVVDNFQSADMVGVLGVFFMTASTVLPGKQDTFGEVLKNYMGFSYQGAGLNPTILGEAYAELGVISMLAYMMLYGFLVGYIYKTMRLRGCVKYIFLYVYMMSVFTIGVLTGVMAHASYFFHFFVLLMVFRMFPQVKSY